jgi:hypothetical protein
MMAVSAVILVLVGVGYFTWPRPASPEPEPPDARFEDGVLHVGYRGHGEDNWEVIPAGEAHVRAQEELGFTFTLPNLPTQTLGLARVAIFSAPTGDPRPAGQYYTANITYVMHPVIDDDGRIPIPRGFSGEASDDENVPMWLSVEYPVSSLDRPPEVPKLSTASIADIAARESPSHITYTWLIGAVRYGLTCTPMVRACPREALLAIVESTAPTAE